MLNGIYSSATALDTASTHHEIIASNLANVNSIGFRRTLLAVEKKADSQFPNDSAVLRGNQISRALVDFSQGDIRSTGRSLDVALSGDGFFSVQTNSGIQYTRNGFFQVSEDNQLITGDGLPVLGGGSPIQIPPGFDVTKLNIQKDGNLIADGTSIGQLDIVSFEDNHNLTPIGTSRFAAPSTLASVPSEAQVLQGSLEGANTKSVSEMIQMIMGARNFESAQRALRTISESIEKFVNIDQ